MNQRFLFSLFVGAVGAALLSLQSTATTAQAALSPIEIEQCFITAPKLMRRTASGTQIDYKNLSSKVARSVTFAVGYRNAQSRFVRNVTDVGKFAPGALIKHHFALYKDVTYAGRQANSCAAIAVKWRDGSRWMMR